MPWNFMVRVVRVLGQSVKVAFYTSSIFFPLLKGESFLPPMEKIGEGEASRRKPPPPGSTK